MGLVGHKLVLHHDVELGKVEEVWWAGVSLGTSAVARSQKDILLLGCYRVKQEYFIDERVVARGSPAR